MDDEPKAVFDRVMHGQDLTREQARQTFERIMAGRMSEGAMRALLTALAAKGESVAELVGAAEAMRASAIRIRCDADCIDTCGTGGDGISTYNVSTAAAIIAAGAGAVVAKHGNRSTSRVSGSTEVLGRLGIDVDAPPDVVERSLADVGIGYLNARRLHPAMKHAAPVRAALPFRTIFNLLGPLTNPAGARRQVLGVPRVALQMKIAEALLQLGAQRVWVVHGEGLCDLTVTGTTSVVEVFDGKLKSFDVTPASVGLSGGKLDDLRVESAADSARCIEQILDGAGGVIRDHALMNAGAALVVAGKAEDLRAGVSRAAEAIDSGAARSTLDRWRATAGLGHGADREGSRDG